MKSGKWASIVGPAVFLLLPFAYFLIWGGQGFSETDQGFIPALAWRILNGETPYLDFIYVRPPLSLYLHAFLMKLLPETWAIKGGRLIFYLFMAFSTYFGVRSLDSLFASEEGGKQQMWWISSIAFVLAVHNFPATPWHTVDGLLLGSTGFFFLTRGNKFFHIGGGMLFLFLAACTKQSFYPVPILGLLWVAFSHPRKTALLTAVSSLGAAAGCGFLLYLLAPDMTQAFLQQSTGVTRFSDLLQAGFSGYLKPLGLITLPLLALSFGVSHWGKAQKLPRFLQNGYEKGWWGASMGFLIFLLMAFTTVKALSTQSWQSPQLGWPQVVWGIALAMGVWGAFKIDRKWVILIALVGLGWCAGISWGYAWPILFAAPLVGGLLVWLREGWKLTFRLPHYVGTFAGVLLLNGLLLQFPYQENGPTSHHLGDIYPKLSGIYSHENRADKLEELQTLTAQYGNSFSVLPAMPLAHYLNNSAPTMPVDWAHNAEANYAKNETWLLQQLESGPKIVFIEKDKAHEGQDTGRYGSNLTAFVMKNWKRTEELAYFYVYEP